MFIEVEVEAGNNCDYSLHRVFSVVSGPRRITQVETAGVRGEVGFFEVTGWSAVGPCAAYAAVVEDSGEGHALLIYGGDDGIRLRPVDAVEPWGLQIPDQSGEPCLLLDKTTPYVPVDEPMVEP